MEKKNIDCLIVDDEVELADATSEYFNMYDLTTKCAYSFEDCFDVLKSYQPKVILLDINLKDKSGFAICKKLRETMSIPILFISARKSDDDILLALNIGGDDYIQKPYSLSILLAKVKATLKRCGSVTSGDGAKQCEIIKFDDTELNVSSMLASRNGQALELKMLEFKLLLYFVKNPNRVISKQELFDNVWGDSFVSDGTLNVHVRKLREKIESDPNNPKRILTVWGTGYRFEI